MIFLEFTKEMIVSHLSISCSFSDVHRWRANRERREVCVRHRLCASSFPCQLLSLQSKSDWLFPQWKPGLVSPPIFIHPVKLQPGGRSLREVGWLRRHQFDGQVWLQMQCLNNGNASSILLLFCFGRRDVNNWPGGGKWDSARKGLFLQPGGNMHNPLPRARSSFTLLGT